MKTVHMRNIFLTLAYKDNESLTPLSSFFQTHFRST